MGDFKSRQLKISLKKIICKILLCLKAYFDFELTSKQGDLIITYYIFLL